MTAASADAAAVRELIGREPRAGFAVAVRCPFGSPAIILNRPIGDDGHPFPTRAWLCCRALVDSVSRLEAEGGVRRLEQDEAMAGAVAGAHARHRLVHAGHNVGGVGDPGRVKCLHAQLAFALSEGGTPVGAWIWRHSAAGWPERCCRVDRAVA